VDTFETIRQQFEDARSKLDLKKADTNVETKISLWDDCVDLFKGWKAVMDIRSLIDRVNEKIQLIAYGMTKRLPKFKEYDDEFQKTLTKFGDHIHLVGRKDQVTGEWNRCKLQYEAAFQRLGRRKKFRKEIGEIQKVMGKAKTKIESLLSKKNARVGGNPLKEFKKHKQNFDKLVNKLDNEDLKDDLRSEWEEMALPLKMKQLESKFQTLKRIVNSDEITTTEGLKKLGSAIQALQKARPTLSETNAIAREYDQSFLEWNLKYTEALVARIQQLTKDQKALGTYQNGNEDAACIRKEFDSVNAKLDALFLVITDPDDGDKVDDLYAIWESEKRKHVAVRAAAFQTDEDF